MQSTEQCLIWPEWTAHGVRQHGSRLVVVLADSPRTGGSYEISSVARFGVAALSPTQKACLTTWLVDQRAMGTIRPTITSEVLSYLETKRPLPVHIRADRLLRLIAGRTGAIGNAYDIRSEIDPAAYAWSESVSEGEIGFLIDYLARVGWLDAREQVPYRTLGNYDVPAIVRVTVDGHSHIREVTTNLDATQAFVAMWFDDTTDAAYDHGIKPAIEQAGYSPMRIDRKLDLDKIDDEIIAEIRRSRFLVADFTHGSGGARGGVYFEAGFAQGLGIPVIYTCRTDMVEQLHFDTRQYAHIVWECPEGLQVALRDRIVARLGQGPEVLQSQ